MYCPFHRLGDAIHTSLLSEAHLTRKRSPLLCTQKHTQPMTRAWREPRGAWWGTLQLGVADRGVCRV